MLSGRQALLQITALTLLWCLAHPAFAQVTAEWTTQSIEKIYCGAVVCGDTARSRFLVTSGSGYIDIEQTLQEGLSDVIGTQSRMITMWVEQGIEYEITLSTNRVNGNNTLASASSTCYSVSFDSPAFTGPATLNTGPFSSQVTPGVYLCMAVVEMTGEGGDEFQVNATDGDFADRVRITWNEQDGATDYEVYRCTSEEEADCGAALVATASNAYDDTGGAHNTTYYYRVKACSGGPCGDFSPADPGYRSYDDHGNSCEEATLVGANSTTAGEIEESGDVDYFRIELNAVSLLTVTTTGSTDTRGKLYDADCILGPLESDSDDGADSNFLISRDLAEGVYWVEVSYQGGSGTGAYDFVSESSPSSELPWDASYVNASDGTDDTFVLLTWPRAPLSLASAYNLYRSDTPESEKVFLKKVWAYETDSYGYETSVPDLTPGVHYFFWVFSENSNGESASGVYDEGWRGIPVADAPEPPTLDSAIPGIGQVVLHFTANGDGGSAITGFTATCGAFSESGPSSPITVSGLTNGVEYSCTVVATNAIGDSPPSNTLSATPSAPDPVFLDGFEGE